MSDTTGIAIPLSQGAGYGVIIGLGALFAIVVVGISQSLRRFSGVAQSASEYAVASRSLGTGLTAAGAVSAWCWSVTLLSSVSTAYNYGVAGAMIYGAGNMSQITLFSMIAIQMKRKAPSLHTHLELIHIRYGTASHLTVVFFALATNILVVSAVLVGAAATINALTGISIYAGLWLLPLAVGAYTLTGGLRSTILADYLHTIVIFIILFVLWFVTYASSDLVGSPGRMYDLLVQAAVSNPSPNYQGSWMTLKSIGAIKFGWLSFLEYTGVVFMDASFHQKGIAAGPDAAVPGYILGSLSWFSLPWCLATTAGLLALALETTSPAFPTYPNRMSTSEVSAGLVLPYAAYAILGKGGAAAILLLMFMSSTSAISAQLMAVASISGYDLFKTYFKRSASADEILRVQQYSVIGFTIFMGAFGSLLHGVGVDLGFLYNITGVWSTAALSQICFTFFGTRLPRWAVFPGVWISFGAGVAVWLGLASRIDGSITTTSLGDSDVCLYTFATAIGTGLVICTIGSIFTPQNFDWSSIWTSAHLSAADENEVEKVKNDERFSAPNLKKWLNISIIASVIIFSIFMLIWPLSMYRDYTFTRSFFVGWVGVSLAWALVAFTIVGIYPLWEGRRVFWTVALGLWLTLSGKESKGDTTPSSPAESVSDGKPSSAGSQAEQDPEKAVH